MKNLADLPNTPGFTFIGIDLDGKEIDCVVRRDRIGCCGAYTLDGELCYLRLVGWDL